MRDDLFLEEEQFEFVPELESEAGGADYARWIQRALNAVMGLKLATDGVLGVQTRSAIRSFQQRRGLAPDGVVGAQTQAALLSAGSPPLPGASQALAPTAGGGASATPCATLTTPEVLDNFAKDSADIKPQHD